MKFNQKDVVPFLKGTGLTFAGIAAPYAASQIIPANFRKFVPIGAGIAGAALVLFTGKSDEAKKLGTGMATYGMLAGVSQFTKDASGNVATVGIKGIAAKFIPQLGSAPSLGSVFTDYEENNVPRISAANEFPEYESQEIQLMGVGEGLMM